MLTIQRLQQGKIKEIGNYLAKDNYYTKKETNEHSEWYGVGAEQLGLTGKVKADDFGAVLSGEVGGQRLGKRVINEATGEQERKHRPGMDLTFSAPKSVSILSEVYQRQDVRAAHLKAVRQTLDYVQEHLIQTRLFTQDKTVERINTKNGVFALFTHDVSRDLDPALHTHSVLLNATLTERGWRSIVNDLFHDKEAIHKLGRMYRTNLAEELTRLGLKLRPHARSPTLFEVEGVPEELITQFSKRAEKIRSFFDERKIDYDPVTAKKVALLTRDRKKAIPRDELIKLWKDQVGEHHFKPEQLFKPGAGGGSHDTANVQTVFRQAIDHLLEKDMAFTERELYDSVLYFGLGKFKHTTLEAEYERLKKTGALLQAKEHADQSREQLWTTLDAKRIEQRLLDTALRADHMKPLYKHNVVQRALSQTRLNETQKQAVIDALKSTKRFFAIQGDAGVGKTTTLNTLKRILLHERYDVLGLASSYQAANELGKSMGIQGLVVDRYLADPNRQRYHQTNRPQVWLVDEAGMLGSEKVIEIMDLAKAQNARVFFIADHKQLEAVGAGRAFKQMLEAGIEHTVINKHMRPKTELMKSVFTHTYEGNYGTALSIMQEHNLVSEHAKEEKAIPALVGHWLSLDRKGREDTIIITPTNEQRKLVNETIRDGLIEERSVKGKQYEFKTFEDQKRTKEQKKTVSTYLPGDVIRFDRDVKYNHKTLLPKGEYYDIVGKNVEDNTLALRARTNKKLVVINPGKANLSAGGVMQIFDESKINIAEGDKLRWIDNKNDLGIRRNTALTVQYVCSTFMRVTTEDNKTIKISLGEKENRHFTYDYARTAYGVQGQTNKSVLALMSSWRRNTTHQRSFLVGVTRASHDVKLYVDSVGELKKVLSKRSGDNAEALTTKEFEKHVRQEHEDGRQKQRSGRALI